MSDGYYGKINSEVYDAAIRLRGDDDTCWEERVPLAEPPLIFGPTTPEDWFGDYVIAVWEEAHSEATTKYGKDGYVLESVSLYLKVNDYLSPGGDMAWKSNVKSRS